MANYPTLFTFKLLVQLTFNLLKIRLPIFLTAHDMLHRAFVQTVRILLVEMSMTGTCIAD